MTVQESSGSPRDAVATDNLSLVITEYNALREEILKRIEIDHQLIALALIAPGTLLTIGLQVRSASIIFVYPFLALFLSMIWVLNETGIHEAGEYIRDRIESKVGENCIGWQHYRSSRKIEMFWALSNVGPRAIFIGTELLAILAGISVARLDAVETVLLIVDILSALLTIALLARFPLRRMVQLRRRKI